MSIELQLQLIFGLVGKPTEENWPGFNKLPGAKDIVFDEKYTSPLRERFKKWVGLSNDEYVRTDMMIVA